MKRKTGFTLIELLIVVTIIAILAAIAVPNFLEAQTRARTSRCMADMRSLATGVEAYAVDFGVYPLYGQIRGTGEIQSPARDNNNAMTNQMAFASGGLTTPVSYITRIPDDPFATVLFVKGALASEAGNRLMRNFEYLNLDQHVANFTPPVPPFAPRLLPAWGHWRMVAAGPDQDRGVDIKSNRVYDATNGTVSNGDVVRCQRFPENRFNELAP